MSVKKVAVGGVLAAMACWGFFAWGLTGAFIAHLFTNG
jgi:hypothetical protein